MKLAQSGLVWLVSLMLLMCTASAAFGAEAGAEDFFPIMPWNHAPHDPAVLKRMHECGFTVAGFVDPANLDAVHAAGMKAIVVDARCADYDWRNVDAAKARANIKSLVDQVNSHPAVFGYYLRDEPPAGFFDGLEKVASAIRELAPGKWPYINMYPNYVAPSELVDGSYEKYLDKFVEICKPPILSYDHYALLDNGGLRDGYWQNLEQMRAAAKKAKSPFWNIVLSCAHFAYREPSLADLRFEVYSTLAYGGRGISYFTYFCPLMGNYRAAPIDQFGNETPTWANLRNVNLQILKLAPTLLKLTSDDVYHFGKVPAGCHAPGDKSLLTAVNGDAMAGDFTHADGSRWVMVVNRDVNKSFPCQPTYRNPPKKVELMSPYNGSLMAFEGEQIWLAPGAGVLLKLTY